MYIQYKVNTSENLVDTLKVAIRLRKFATLCFPKGGSISGRRSAQIPVWLMYLVTVITSGPGNLQAAKNVVVTEGKFKDYRDEIQHSYELGFTYYRLHKTVDGTFVTPIRVYDGKVFVLDDVATMEVGNRDLITDEINRKLIYFANGDGSSGVALQGDRGASGARGL